MQYYFYNKDLLKKEFFHFCTILSLCGVLFFFSACSISDLSKKDEEQNNIVPASQEKTPENAKIPEKIPTPTPSSPQKPEKSLHQTNDTKKHKPANPSQLQKITAQEQEIYALQTQSQIKLQLQTLREDKDSITVEVFIENPDQKEIQSVQAWFLYPISILEGEEIIFKNSEIFSLIAPNENTFDRKNGIVKIGVSTEGGSKKTPKKIGIAEVSFKKNSTTPFLLEFFTPKNQVMVFTKNGLRNVLKKK